MRVDSNNFSPFPLDTIPAVTPRENLILPYSTTQYPQITNVSFSSCTFNALKDVAYGQISELTMLATYNYQSSVTTNLALKNSLNELADVERDHLNVLASTIVAFGGNPNYKNSNGSAWMSSYVCFEKDPSIFIKNDICKKQRLILKYEDVKRCIKSLSVLQLINKLIADENAQIIYLNNLLTII